MQFIQCKRVIERGEWKVRDKIGNIMENGEK